MLAEAKPLVERKTIRLAMLGMVDGNGHPYSWSAIFNGFDPAAMAACPFAGIPAYLNKEPKETLRIPNVHVTHIWTDDPPDASHVAKASLIPNVVRRPEDVIGEVDAVIIATDKGHEHVDRCRPFVEAGLPIFVDKPMVDNEKDLRQFNQWAYAGAPILSSSSMRYCKEYLPYYLSTHELGELRYIGMTMAKTWERYGIHAMEGVYPILGPGFLSARNTGTIERNIVHLTHRSGVQVVIANIMDMYGGFGALQLAGTAGSAHANCVDTFYMFKRQLESFITYLRTGERPFPYAETVELMKIIIAGIKSREQGGREVKLEEIAE
ncbi:MAG: Gfo/Idh/MocA family oxidoreductase [Armatimonadota bacterium]